MNSHNISSCFKCVGLFIVILCIAIPLLGADVTIWPKEIKFNYDSGSSTYDAITLKSSSTTYIDAPEWEYNGGTPTSESFAYVMNQNSRKIQVCFDSNCSNEMLLFITMTVTSGTGIGTVCNYFICNYTKLDWVTITLDGSTPGSIGTRNFTWQWSIYAIPVGGALCAATSTYSTSHTYYTLLAAPQSPMEEPWISVLNYASSWANGQMSASSSIQKIVEGLYNNTSFLYDTYDGSPRYTYNGTTSSFNLTSMLSEIGGINIVVDCYDMGKALKIFANALGCNSSYVFSYPFGYHNCIKAIGKGWANNPFYDHPYFSSYPIVGEDDDDSDERSSFGNHAFCRISTIYYDACLKVDTDVNPDAAPHTESWAYGWDWSTYKSKVWMIIQPHQQEHLLHMILMFTKLTKN